MKIDGFGQAKILSPQEIELLFEVALNKARDKALFAICLYTACRINEACTLRESDVQGLGGSSSTIVFRKSNTKGKRATREIRIHPKLQQYLEEYGCTTGKDFLFPGRHGRNHIQPTSASMILHQAFISVGIEGASTHSLRRTALTQMHNEGIPLRHIQAISGHQTLAALARYLEVSETEKEYAILALDFK